MGTRRVLECSSITKIGMSIEYTFMYMNAARVFVQRREFTYVCCVGERMDRSTHIPHLRATKNSM